MLAKAQGIEGTEAREPQALEAARRRGVDAITAGDPYLLHVRVAPAWHRRRVPWHQRFTLRA